VRPGAQLEQHRSESQRRDCARDGVPLGRQLVKRGAHEHAQALVRCPNGHVTPETWRIFPWMILAPAY
jgi:hypothetical protein